VVQFDCDILPAPFDCTLNLPTGDEGVGCPKGDIPYGQYFCSLEETNWLTLYSSSDFEYSYEFRTNPPGLCPSLPQFFGPSSNGVLEIEGSGCPAYEAVNCSMAHGGLYATKWCYQFKLFFHKGNGCDIEAYSIPMRTMDLVGNDGAVDSSDLSGLASLLGTKCCPYGDTCDYTGGPKFNPIADYNGDDHIDGTDLALFAAHLGHNCSQWTVSLPQKATMADYPWEVLDRPDMQAAMERAGVDRDFIVQVWLRNGPEQRLFVQPTGRSRLARVAEGQLETSAPLKSVVWGGFKELYR
jgi:hypothetical protein